MNSILTITMNAVIDYLLLVSVIAVLLVGVAWCIIKLARIKAPVNLHMVWLFTLITVVILPALWLYGPKLPISILSVENPFVEGILLRPVNINSGMPNEPFSLMALFSGKNIIVWLWSAGFIFLSTRLIVSGYRLSGIISSSIPVSGDILPANFFTKKVKLLRTPHLDSPVCLGLTRPLILLPNSMYQNSSPEELRMILHHELAHITRKDCWVNLFQRVVEAILFFHPFVWYASHQLTDQREQLCDNHVIRDGVSPVNYVKMLTSIAEQCLDKKEYHAVALFEGKLLTRVSSLLEPGNKNQTRASFQATVIGLMVMLMFIAIGTIHIEAKVNAGGSSGSLPVLEIQSQIESLFSTAYNLVDVDEYPAFIEQSLPNYPQTAFKQKIEGRVVVRLVIDNEGYPREPEIYKAEPEGYFEEAALESVAKFRFRPAVKDGKNVDCIARIPVVFSISK